MIISFLGYFRAVLIEGRRKKGSFTEFNSGFLEAIYSSIC